MLYVLLIQERTDTECFLQTYWVHASHLGEGIEKAIAAAKQNGLKMPEARECLPYDPAGLVDIQEPIAPSIDAEVFWGLDRFCFTAKRPLFSLPYGIVGSCIEGEHSVDELEAGFSGSTNDEGLITVTINASQPELFSLYKELLDFEPGYAGLAYALHDHWDDGDNEVYTNTSLTSSKKIISYLEENEMDSILNGHVSLIAYLKNRTELLLSDHKCIVISSNSDQMIEKYILALQKRGYEFKSEMIGIDDDMPHWHYRHSKSKTRSELVEHLITDGFLYEASYP